MKERYNVAYQAPDGIRFYLLHNADLATAEKQLAQFKTRYLNKDGTGKPYPNGKGVFPFHSPKIVKV